MWFAAPIHDDLPIKGLTFNFMPLYWHQNIGIEYGYRMVLDPNYRVKTWREMERCMYRRFREIHLGSPDPNLVLSSPIGTTLLPRRQPAASSHIP